MTFRQYPLLHYVLPQSFVSTLKALSKAAPEAFLRACPYAHTLALYIMRKKISPKPSWLWLDMALLLCLGFIALTFWNYATDPNANALPSHWHWDKLSPYIAWHDAEGWHMGLLIKGLLSTLRLGLWACLLALMVGLALGIYLATHTTGLLHNLLSGIIIFLRNTPPLVLLFLLYFLTSEQTLGFISHMVRLAPQPLQDIIAFLFATPEYMDRMLAAVLTLGCYQGAYVAEIVRAGLQSLPQGQWDGAAALGFSRRQQFFHVLLPQALPLMLPPLAGQAISTFKDSALAALISVPELTFQGMEIVAITRLPFEAWTLILVLYLGISLLCTRCFALAEKKMHWHHKNKSL